MGSVPGRPSVIDVHTHMVPSRIDSGGTAGWRIALDTDAGGSVSLRHGGTAVRTFGRAAWDPELRIETMRQEGVLREVVLPNPALLFYEEEPEVGAGLAHQQNHYLSQVVREHPSEFSGFGTLPLQDAQLAVMEIEAIAADGELLGVMLGSQKVNELAGTGVLDDVWRALDDKRLRVFLHPVPSSVLSEPPAPGAKALVGPIATGLAAAAVMAEGLLDRHPDVPVCLAHAGGCFPSLVGRMERVWDVVDGRKGEFEESPRELARAFWADTLTFDADGVRLAAKVFGSDHLMVGTDGPGPAREVPRGLELDTLSAENSGLEDAYARNACRFLGL